MHAYCFTHIFHILDPHNTFLVNHPNEIMRRMKIVNFIIQLLIHLFPFGPDIFLKTCSPTSWFVILSALRHRFQIRIIHQINYAIVAEFTKQ